MAEIKVSHLTFSYDGKREVLSNMSFQLGEGETVGLIGANGTGKSTILRLLVGLLSGHQGSILVDGVEVEKKSLEEVRRKIGYVFQDSDSQLFLSTVYEDVAFGPRNYGYSKEEVEKRVLGALEQVHMEEWKDRQIYRLSGGQKKLAAIATILSMEPEILLFDEPSIALDPRNRKNLIHIIKEMKGTKLIASHDLDLILDTCPRTILIAHSRIIFDGKTKDILTNQKLLCENGLELPLSMGHMRTLIKPEIT